MSMPRPQYPTYPGPTGKKLSAPPMRQPPMHQPPLQPPPSEAMLCAPVSVGSSNTEEVRRFVEEAWSRVTNVPASDPECPVYYRDKQPNQFLKDFKPFDLDAWCERRRSEKEAGSSA